MLFHSAIREDLFAIEFAPDSSRVAIAEERPTGMDWNRVLCAREARSGRTIRDFAALDQAAHVAIAFSPRGKEFAASITNSDASTLDVWRADGEAIFSEADTFSCWSIAYACQGERLACCTDGEYHVLDTNKLAVRFGGKLPRYSDHDWTLGRFLSCSQRGDRVAVGCHERLTVLSAQTGDAVLVKDVPHAEFVSVALNKAGTRVAAVRHREVAGSAAATKDELLPRLMLVNLVSKRVAEASGKFGTQLIFTSDGEKVLAVPNKERWSKGSKDDEERCVAIWSVADEDAPKLVRVSNFPISFGALIDGTKLLAVANEEGFSIWDLERKLDIPGSKRLQKNCSFLRCSPDGTLMVSVEGDGGAAVWDIKSLLGRK